MASSFSLDANPQSSSPMFNRLSPELREIIFRNLLLPSRGAQAEGKFVEKDAIDNRAHLSSQLLRCCQKMYMECEAILYGQNKVRIVLQEEHLMIVDGCFHTFLNNYKQSNMFPIQGGKPNLDLANLGSLQIAEETLRGSTDEQSLSNSFLHNNYSAVSRIRQVEIHFECASQRQVYNYVRLLKDVVKNKRVTVVWKLENIAANRAINLLRTLYLWRCSSLNFRGLQANLFTTASEMHALITSSKPVQDLWLQVYSIYGRADLPKSAQYILSNNIGDSDDEEGEDKGLSARMLRDRFRRCRSQDEVGSVSDMPANDMGEVWTAIRHGDADKLALWEQNFLGLVTRLASL